MCWFCFISFFKSGACSGGVLDVLVLLHFFKKISRACSGRVPGVLFLLQFLVFSVFQCVQCVVSTDPLFLAIEQDS